MEGSVEWRWHGGEAAGQSTHGPQPFDLHGNCVYVVMLAALHRRRVMPQQPEGKFPLILYLGLFAQIRQLVFQVLLFRGCHELQFYLPVAPVVHLL